jgi:hypothetical protein
MATVPTINFRPVTTSRSRAIGALMSAALLAAACEDPLENRASRPNVDVALETWSLSGSPPSFPAALLVAQTTMVPPDAAGSFDIAFEIDDTGRLRVMPVTKVVTPITGNRTIGLMLSHDTYSAIIEAPRTGWVFDSVFTVNPGQTFLVKVQAISCQFDFQHDIYAKIHVDAVFLEERRALLSARVNPNCGFRSFATGIPTY